MTLKQAEERLTKIESLVESLLLRLGVVEKKLETVEILKQVDDAGNRQAILELLVEDMVKNDKSETDSRVLASELSCEEMMKVLDAKFSKAVDKVIAIEAKVEKLSGDWPTPGAAAEVYIVATNKRNEARRLRRASNQKSSHAEKYKDKSKETIVLLVDSLARGVGAKLEYQSNMVSAICRPGAHIDDITEEVRKLRDNEDRHVVLLVGTNDIQGEGSEVMLSKYKNLIEASQTIKNRKVSVVGIPRRGDLDSFCNSRRLGVNNRLKEMCKGSNVEFLDYEPRDSWLARDGLHLNHLGQNELGFKIYQHCKSFLL